ncbi:MAG TPA: PAS domain S-box protein, partial [Ktedonobacterales bacterium]
MISIQTLLDRLRAQVAVQLDTLKVSGPSYFARRTKQVGSLRTRKGRQMLWRSALPLLTYAVAFVIAQYAGAALAFAVSPKLEGATPLYLQGAITVSALLLTPPRRWWLYLLLTLPLMFIDAWLLSLAPSAALMRVLLFVYIILVCIAVLTVSLLRRCVTLPLRFASVGEISRFVACVAVGAVPAAFIATVLRSVLLSWDVWLSWQSGFFGYVLGIVVFTPAIVLWLTNGPGGLGLTSRGRRVEIALLSLATVTVSVFVFTTHLPDDTVVSALSYLLVPVLLWAAVRFSPLVVASALAISTTIAIIGAVNNGGPFVFSSTTANVLALQLYLVFIGVPFYFLAALVQERKQVDGALQASEARYRGVVESQTELISRSLPDTTLTFVNEAHARHLGKSPAELLGRRWIELVPDAERERVQNHIQSLLEQPGVATIEHAVTLPDGSLGWQQWVNRSLGDAVGRVIELQSVGRDVTERKRLEQEREEARAQAERQAEELARVFETVTDGVAVYDQRGQEVRTNAALHRLLGLDMAPPEYAQMSLHERMALFAARDERGRPLAQNEGPLPRALAGVAGAEAMDMR